MRIRRALAAAVPVLAALLLSFAAPAEPANASARPAGACGSRTGTRTLPVALRVHALAGRHRADGRWRAFAVVLRNNTGRVCRHVSPLVTFAAGVRALHPADLQVEGVRLTAALGELVAPLPELTLRPGATRVLRLRVRFPRAAPRGRWVVLALADRPLDDHGRLIPWPIGVSDPVYLHVTGVRRG